MKRIREIVDSEGNTLRTETYENAPQTLDEIIAEAFDGADKKLRVKTI